MNSRRSLVITLAVCVLISGIAFPMFGAGSALAQDDDGDVPSLPATYYGELEITDGTLSEPVLIEAVADGEVQDSIMTDETGQFGGPTISDEKLAVQPPDSDEVTFRVGGVVVDTVPFASATQEINLSASQEELAPFFTTSVTGSNSPVDGGETVTVDATIENEGALSETQDVNLVNANGDVLDSTSVSLAYNESTTTTLSWETDTATSVNETFIVESADTAASINIEVVRVTPPQIAPEPSSPTTGGGTSGGSGTDDTDGTDGSSTDDDTTETDTDVGAPELPADVEALHTEQQTIVSDDGFDLSQVRFSEESNVISITWSSAGVAGNVSVVRLNSTSSETGPGPGALVSFSQVTVPDNVTDESATVQFRENRTRIEELGAEAGDLQVFRFADGEWQQVDTIVVEESSNEIVLQAETPGFSYFAVSATSEPEADISSPAEATVGDTVSLSAGNSTDQYGDIVSYEWIINGEPHNGKSVTTEFEQPGDVEVELTVKNDANKTDTTTTMIPVVESSDASTGTSSEGSSENTESTDGSIPGFTFGLALLALFFSVLIARQRTD